MFSLRIAFRYLFSKKSSNAINLISYISMAGMGVGAFALIVVLSVLNGFEGVIKDLYNVFYPEIVVKPATGKWMVDADALEGVLQEEKNVASYTKVLEENAYFEYDGKATIATVKGVDERYAQTTEVAEFVRRGDFLLRDSNRDYAVIGANINMALNASTDNAFAQLSIRVPKLSNASVFLPEDAFNTAYVTPSGIFSIQPEFDAKYVIVSLETAQGLVGEEVVSAVEVKLDNGMNAEKFRDAISKKLGDRFFVQTRDEMNEVLYRVAKIERFAVFAILSFILFIISFNIIGSLTMLALEKKKDISILKAMGATPKQITHIFLFEGMLNALIGASVGLLAGLALCWLQMNYGMVKLADGGASFVVDAYPVKVVAGDVALAFCTVAVISLLASVVPAAKAAKQKLDFA